MQTYFLFHLLSLKYICATSSGLLTAKTAILCVRALVCPRLPGHACMHAFIPQFTVLGGDSYVF